MCCCVQIMKDMERWAKIQNRQKEIVRAASPVLKGGVEDDRRQSKSADAGFAVFERKVCNQPLGYTFLISLIYFVCLPFALNAAASFQYFFSPFLCLRLRSQGQMISLRSLLPPLRKKKRQRWEMDEAWCQALWCTYTSCLPSACFYVHFLQWQMKT